MTESPSELPTRPDDRLVCPMDGAHLREIRMESGQSTEYGVMTGQVCACGCGKPPAGSFWATDTCMANWLRKINDLNPPNVTVRTFCGATYTETPARPADVKRPPSQLAPGSEGVGPQLLTEAGSTESTPADVTEVPLKSGWLARALDRLGRTR